MSARTAPNSPVAAGTRIAPRPSVRGGQPPCPAAVAPRRLGGASAFDAVDLRRLQRAVLDARRAANADAATLLPACASGDLVATLRARSAFVHRALLLFPETLAGGLRTLAQRGLKPAAPIPSVLVPRRLAERHGVAREACDVSITRVAGGLVEIFLLPTTAHALAPWMIDAERHTGFENHAAFEVDRPDEPLLERLFVLCARDGLAWEGGGHNPHEDSTVLYFVTPRSADAPLARIELHCAGDFSALIARHPVDAAAVAAAYSGRHEEGSGGRHHSRDARCCERMAA